MNELHAVSLLPFVSSGKDYDASRRLFADLGFEETWENGRPEERPAAWRHPAGRHGDGIDRSW